MTHAMRIGALGTLVAILLTPIAALAAEFRVGDQPTFASGEISDDLYMAGGNITAGGLVRGDLSVAGGNLLINGPVTVDLNAAGGSVTVNSNVGDDVHIAGGNIIVQGQVGDDLLVTGGQITVSGEGIGGDLAGAGGMLRVEAPVRGNLKVAGGDIYINAPITGNADIKAEKVTLGPKAVIGGDFIYSAKNEAIIEEGAVVRGDTQFTETKTFSKVSKGGIIAAIAALLFSKFLMVLVGALVIAYVFRRFAETIVTTTITKPFMELVRGTIFVIVTPVVALALFFTVIGIPFGLLGLLGLAMSLVLVSLVAPIVVGSVLHRWMFKPIGYQVSWKTVLLGAVVMSLLPLIPFIGGLAKLVIILGVLGAVIKVKWNILQNWR